MESPSETVETAFRTRADIAPLLRELKGALDELYGERLAKLVLYGSFARGEATDTSDIDVLVVLRGEVNEWAEIKRMSHVTQPIALEYEELIAKLPLSLNEYETRRSPLLINVRKEGIVL
jgi:predicted nucleotidyltransferase